MINVKELTTGYIIDKPSDNFEFYKINSYFRAKDYATDEYVSYGVIDEEKLIRVPKIPMDKLERMLDGLEYKILVVPATPSRQLSKTMHMKNQPKDNVQKEVIENVMNSFNAGENRVVVSLPTGQGKTYVATNIISKINKPTIIFVKTIDLRKQWFKSITEHSTMRNIAVVDGSADLVSILEAGINYDIIITTHSTVRSFITRYSMRDFNKLLITQGIGFKIYDEFDLETESMFRIDTNTSIEKTLYLSATDYKSAEQNKVFQSIYGHIPNFGKEYGLRPERSALFILFKSNPDPKTYGSCHMYIGNEFKFAYHKYHEYIVKRKTYLPAMKYLWEKMIKSRFYDKTRYNKIVFFIGRKTTAEQFRKDFIELSGVKKKDISILNSDIPKNQREEAMSKKLIISTADSMGRGLDLKGLDMVIDLETRSSQSKTEQVVGRVSRTGAERPGLYVSLIDGSFPTVVNNYNRKIETGLMNKLFTKISVLDMIKKK